MKKRDGRKLSSEAQYEIRLCAVRMVCEEGYSKKDAAVALGVSRQNVGKWVRLYEDGGLEALELGRRGRVPGQKMRLAGWQSACIVKLITDNTPDQLKMAFVLWTAPAVRDLVHERFGIMLPVRSMRRYLRRWGMTPQKPVRRSLRHDSAELARWVDVEYPRIASSAKKRGAKIYWVDETGITNHANSQRGYSRRGQTPELKQEGTKRRINMISGITNKGDVRWMCYQSTMTQSKFILFLGRLAQSEGGAVTVITDNLPVHHGKRVAQWLKDSEYDIELEFIPSYSPEANPDEYLNRDLKKNVNAKRMPRNQKELKENVVSFMRSIQKKAGRVVQYFASRHVAFAR
jgi:transposase